MHRHSLRYRLARVEQVLGRSLKQPSTIAAVCIALVAEAGEHAEPWHAPKNGAMSLDPPRLLARSRRP